LLDGRGFLLPEVVMAVAVPAWGHRLVLKLQAYADAVSADDIVTGLLASVPAPPADRADHRAGHPGAAPAGAAGTAGGPDGPATTAP
jgi:MoxR-like ATPase